MCCAGLSIQFTAMGLAAMTADNTDPVDARVLTLADIEKIAGTEGAEAADAALQRMKLAREAREAEAPADIENLDKLLDGLELGADEALEVIEHLELLDAAGEDAVEGVIAKAEAYEAQDVLDEARKEPNKLREQMRAARAKINGGVGVAPDDPLATDKIRVARYLKKYDRTPDDLPAGFWDEPDRDVRGILLGQVVGPIMAERRSAKQL
jgi:hypothetical protein